MVENKKKQLVEATSEENNIPAKKGNNILMALVAGAAIGAIAVLLVFNLKTNDQTDNSTKTDPSDFTRSITEDETQIEPTSALIVTDMIAEEEWYTFDGKHVKGQYTDDWQINETLGVDLNTLPSGSTSTDASNTLKKLSVSYDGTPIFEMDYLGGGVGYRMECKDEIPVFLDTDKIAYDEAKKDWALNGFNPEFVDITDDYTEFELLGTPMRRVKSVFYYDFYTNNSSFEVDCSRGLNGMVPPFSRISDNTMSNTFDISSIKDNEDLLLQLDKIIDSLEEK